MNTIDPVFGSHPAISAQDKQSIVDSTAFVAMAEKAVVDNFNAHRKAERSPELTVSGVNVIWMTRGIIGWKAILNSPLAKGLMWEVTYNRPKNQLNLQIFSKLNEVKIVLGEDKAA